MLISVVRSLNTQVGKTHCKCPASTSLLMDSVILDAVAFDRQHNKDDVPSWRTGEAGVVLQIGMARLLSIRYFDFELYKNDTAGIAFRSAAEWVAFSRMHPFLLSCFHDRFGSDQVNWEPSTVTRWDEIMRGNWDLEIKSVSDIFPETFDADPVLMINRAWSSPSIQHCHNLQQ